MINKEYLLKNQPILYKMLNQMLKSKTIPHAMLLVGKNTYDIAHYIIKCILCDNDDFACLDCDTCNEIDSHTYIDFIFYSGKEKSIKKEHIEKIQLEFSKSSFGDKDRIYMLENIENSSSTAMNSLLKTLEEPQQGIYAILTTENIEKVLPTIKSRCQVIKLLPDNTNYLFNEMNSNGLSEENSHIFSNIFNSYNEFEPYLQDDKYLYIKNEAYHFIEDLFLNKENLLINVQTHILKKYKDRNTITLFYDIIIYALRDLFHVKHNLSYVFISFKEIYDKIETCDELIISYIDFLLETKNLLNINANVSLLTDVMIYKMQKGVFKWK